VNRVISAYTTAQRMSNGTNTFLTTHTPDFTVNIDTFESFASAASPAEHQRTHKCVHRAQSYRFFCTTRYDGMYVCIYVRAYARMYVYILIILY